MIELAQFVLRVKKLTPTAITPTRATENAAAYDLYADDSGRIPPFARIAIPTGISIAIPTVPFPSMPDLRVYGSIRSRSGLTIRNGLNVGAGVVDADYRGPVTVIIFNHTYTPYDYKRGDRIAQLILETHITPPVEVVTELSETARGENGFGSTGK